VIAGLGKMGCIPSILAQSTTGSCSEEVNMLVQPFNENLKTILGNFNSNLPGARFIFADSSRMFQDILLNARSYGMNEPKHNTALQHKITEIKLSGVHSFALIIGLV